MKLAMRWFAPALVAAVVSVQAAVPAAPQLSLSLRGVAEGVAQPGEPLRIVVRVAAPRASAATIALAPANGAWSDAVSIELWPAVGRASVAKAEGVGRPESSSATLGAGRIAGGLWRFPSEVTQRLAPGSYQVRARLAIRDGSGWKGEVEAVALPLRIVAPSSDPERITQLTVNRAHDALVRGQIEAAAAVLDAQLGSMPDDVRLLAARAEVALRAGNPAAALMCLNRVPPGKSVGPASPERDALLARVRTALREASGTTPKPPAWSWPPAKVMELSAEKKAAALRNALPRPSPAAANTPPVGSGASSGPARPVPATPPVPAPAIAAKAASPGPKIGAPSAGVIVPAAELDDKKIRADAAGQWAASATASSQYSSPRYAPAQATGAPNVPLGMAGDNPDAWCPGRQNDGTEWLEVAFAKPAAATEVRVLQNNAPGAISKVEAIAPDGTVHLWWEGKDPYVAPAIREIAWFVIRVPKTDYAVAKVKLTLNLAAVPGWKQIDAVQLVAAP
ncbi:MAG: tetratricopeptide repeat protein [Opitutaceae bacterium]|nr:tetratricopeptide repeat protein [Opitutaceae bacterium]